MARKNLTAERLRERLHYDPETGIFTWRQHRVPYRIGTVAGGVHDSGTGKYTRICIGKDRYYAHRLAWFYMTGTWPDDIDHRDGNGFNNRFNNLRDVSRSVNLQNQRHARKNNNLGVLGVTKVGNRFCAAISFRKKRLYLGLYATVELAHNAYLEAKRKLHEGCTI